MNRYRVDYIVPGTHGGVAATDEVLALSYKVDDCGVFHFFDNRCSGPAASYVNVIRVVDLGAAKEEKDGN